MPSRDPLELSDAAKRAFALQLSLSVM